MCFYPTSHLLLPFRQAHQHTATIASFPRFFHSSSLAQLPRNQDAWGGSGGGGGRGGGGSGNYPPPPPPPAFPRKSLFRRPLFWISILSLAALPYAYQLFQLYIAWSNYPAPVRDQLRTALRAINQKEFIQAEHAFVQAIELCLQNGFTDISPEVSGIVFKLAELYEMTGRYLDSAETYTRQWCSFMFQIPTDFDHKNFALLQTRFKKNSLGAYVVDNERDEKLISELQFVGLMLMMSVSVSSKIGDILLRAQDFDGALVFYEWTVKTLLGWNDDPRDVLNEFEATVTKRSSPSSEGSSTSTSAVTAAYPHRIADWIEQYYPQWSIKNDSPTSSSLPQMPRSLAHPASAVLENPQNSFSPSTTQSHITSSSSTTTSPLLSDAEAKLQRDHADQHHHHATSHLPIQRLPNRLRPVPWATSLHLGAALEMLAQCYSFKEQHDISLALYMRALQLITDEETAEAQVLAEKRAEGSASSSSSSSSSTSSSSANGGARRRDRNIFMKGVTLGSDERDCRKAILSNNIGNSMLARGDILEAKRWTEKGFKCADVAGHDCAETKVVIMHNLARILEIQGDFRGAHKRYAKAMEEAQDIKYVDGIKLCRESLLRMNRSKQESNSSTSSSSSAETGDIDDSNGKDLVLSQQPQSAVVLEFPKQ